MTSLKLPTKRSGGFTLVESLVSIGILVLAVFGAFSAAQSGLSSTNFSKEQIVAFNLAQEGVEQIRNLRDQNGVNSQGWLTGIAAQASDPCYFGKACMIDAVTGGLPTQCSAPGSCLFLKEDPSTGFFGYTPSWVTTTYRREIQLTSISDHEVSMLVTIDWNKGLIHNQFRVRENILDWQ
jgi:type II secretory pathway pseudopilin PulG